MTDRTGWRDLRVGLIGIGVIVLASVFILLYARVGGVRGKKVTIYVTAPTAGGVLEGTEVLVAGKRVGLVDEVTFQPPSSDTLERLVIKTSILESALPLVRRDSYASIHPSGTFIGAPVVELSVGTAAAGALAEGDTVGAIPETATEGIGARVTALGQELGGVRREWQSIAADLRTAQGTAGAIRTRGPTDFATFRARTATVMAKFSSGRGVIGRAVADETLRRRAASVLASIDTIGTLLSTPTGTIGRFRRDRSLVNQMDSVRAEFAAVTTALEEARGTAGRFQRDRALAREMSAVGREFDALIADVKKNPFRYLSF